MPQFGGDALVEIIRRDAVPFGAVVAGGIVDQDICRSESALQRGEGALQRIDVTQVAGFENRLYALAGLDECTAENMNSCP